MTIQQLQQYPLGEKGLRVIDKDGIIHYLNGISAPDTLELCIIKSGQELARLTGVEENICKPILYPLSCLTQEIEVYGRKFVPMDRIKDKNERYDFDGTHIVEFHYDTGGNVKYETIHTSYGGLPYWIIQLLQSWFINYQGIEAVNPFDLEVNPYK